jgi:hypothetical protein
MKIPKTVKVGKRTITVEEPKAIILSNKTCKGIFDMESNMLCVAKQDSFGFKYSKSERSETFWHELTHAILHDMKNDLTYDEKFVVAFSKRLDQAIKTAKF